MEVTSPANPSGLHLGQPDQRLWPPDPTEEGCRDKHLSQVFLKDESEKECHLLVPEREAEQAEITNCKLTSDSGAFTSHLQGDPDRSNSKEHQGCSAVPAGGP